MRYSARTLLCLLGATSITLLPFAACSSSSGTTTPGMDSGSPEDTGVDSPIDTGKKKDAAKDTGTTKKDTGVDAGEKDAETKDGAGDVVDHDGEVKDGEAKEGGGDAEPKDATTDGPKDGTTDGPKDGTTDATDATDAPKDTGSSAPTVQNYFMGRWDMTAAAATTGIGAVAAWPGTGVITTFLGANIGVTLTDACNAANDTAPDPGCDSVSVELDGAPVTAAILSVGGGTPTQKSGSSFQLASGMNTIELNMTTSPSLGTGTHTIGIYKNTDAFYGGTITFGGFTPASDLATNNPKASYAFAHHIEWIGDENVSGEGIACASGSDPTGAIGSDEHDSVATLVSEYFDAEHHNISESNTGMADADPIGGPPPLISALYLNTLPTEPTSTWFTTTAAAAWIPDLVIVNIGGYSDFYYIGAGTETSAAFTSALESFLATIRMKHTTSFILVTGGPDYSGNDSNTQLNTYLQAAVTARLGAGETSSTIAFWGPDVSADTADATFNYDGCQGRPSVSDAQNIALQLEAEIPVLLPSWQKKTWAP